MQVWQGQFPVVKVSIGLSQRDSSNDIKKINIWEQISGNQFFQSSNMFIFLYLYIYIYQSIQLYLCMQIDTNIGRYIFTIYSQEPVPHPDVFLGHSFLLKQCVDGLLAREAPSWLGLEISKMFNVRCIWESIFVFVENSFCYSSIYIIYLHKICIKNLKNFFLRIFLVPILFKRYQNTSGCGTGNLLQ